MSNNTEIPVTIDAAIGFANEVAWKSPDLEILRPEFKGQYSVLVETLQKKILARQRRGKLILPNLAGFGNTVVGTFSDYGGEHKKSRYLTYSVLVCLMDLRELFAEKVRSIREKHDLGTKEIAYKDLRMGQLSRALPEYLSALTNFLPGFLLTLAVQKTALEVPRSSAKENDLLLEAALNAVGVKGRKPRTNKKLVRVVELVAFLTALLGKDGQKVFWMTDHDEISPTRSKHDETLKAFDALLRVFCRRNQAFSVIGGALPFEKRDVGMLDLLSVADLCAGALAEFLTQKDTHEPDHVELKPECELVLRWLAHDGIGLKKMNIVLRGDGDGTPIESAIIEFGPFERPKNVTVIPISV